MTNKPDVRTRVLWHSNKMVWHNVVSIAIRRSCELLKMYLRHYKTKAQSQHPLLPSCPAIHWLFWINLLVSQFSVSLEWMSCFYYSSNTCLPLHLRWTHNIIYLADFTTLMEELKQPQFGLYLTVIKFKYRALLLLLERYFQYCVKGWGKWFFRKMVDQSSVFSNTERSFRK